MVAIKERIGQLQPMLIDDDDMRWKGKDLEGALRKETSEAKATPH